MDKELNELIDQDDYYTNVLQCAVAQEVQINNEYAKMFPAQHEEVE